MYLITPFTACRYPYAVQRYLRSKSKVVVKRTKFCSFFALPNFKGAVPPKSCTRVITSVRFVGGIGGFNPPPLDKDNLPTGGSLGGSASTPP